jgi:GntR family transcriptional repressor for pyruvate dehydrogenase complex
VATNIEGDGRTAAMEGPSFLRAQRVRSFDDVSEQIRHAIVTGRIRAGQRLPGERELCESFGISRPTLREALRSLEALGLLEIRPGKTGGAYAIAPTESTLGSALDTLVTLRGISARDLAEFRLSFEVENARFAAQRATEADAAELTELVEQAAAAVRGRDWRRVGEVDAAWHEAVARTTQNRLRIGISMGLREAVLRNHAAVLESPRRGRGIQQHVKTIVEDLDAMTRAIVGGQSRKAQQIMRAHVERGNARNAELADSTPA